MIEMKKLLVCKSLERFLNNDGAVSSRILTGLIIADIMISLALAVNWPGATEIKWRYIWPDAFFFVFRDLVYSLPVGVCLVSAMLIVAIKDNCRRLRRAQRRWIVAAQVLSLLSGLFPLYSINHYDRYRLGVSGFLLPFLLVVVMNIWLSRRDNGIRRKKVFDIFVKLFTGTVLLTFIVRISLYIAKL